MVDLLVDDPPADRAAPTDVPRAFLFLAAIFPLADPASFRVVTTPLFFFAGLSRVRRCKIAKRPAFSGGTLTR